MSSPIASPHLIQDTMQVCIWFMILGFAAVVNKAHADEGLFASRQAVSTTRLAYQETRKQHPYKLNRNIAINNTTGISTGYGSTPGLPDYAELKEQDVWSINIQKQAPAGDGCSILKSLFCFDPKEERADGDTQKESFWVVLRKVIHF